MEILMSVPQIASVLVLGLLLSAAAHAAESPFFDIPKLNGVRIDGRDDDWGANGFRIDGLADSADTIRPSRDFEAHVRLGWDQRGLLVLAKVSDDEDVESTNLQTLWQRDCVELFVASKVGALDVWQVVVAPGTSANFPELRQNLVDGRRDPNLKKLPLSAEVQRTKTADGYILEALLPWKNLGIHPDIGEEVGFQIYVDDADRQVREPFHAGWYPVLGAGRDTKLMYRLRLAAKASPPAPPAVWGVYEKFHQTRVNVVAAVEMAGDTIELRQQGDEAILASGPLQAQGTRAIASLTFPMPPRNKPYGPLAASITGQPTALIDLGDPEPRRLDEIAVLNVAFRPAVFAEDKFPAFDFPDPVYARDLLGVYTLKASFFDGKMQKVDAPTAPGRYGAIVEVTTEFQSTLRRFVTLFRAGKAITPQDVADRGTEALVEAGIDPAICRRYESYIREATAARPAQGRNRVVPAVLLAGLSEAKADGPDFTGTSNPYTLDRDWWIQVQKKTNTYTPYRYLEYFPARYDANKDRRWPLLLILHGSGAQGDDLQLLKEKNVVPANLTADLGKLPFVVIAPQCSRREAWNTGRVIELINEVTAKYRIDLDRIYVIGGSMGGFATWALASTIPDRLAAAAPFCGGGDPADAPRLKNLPIWIYHGDEDPVVDISQSNRMFKALCAISARTRYTIYAGAGHEINPYQPELYAWLLEQSRKTPAQSPTTQPTLVRVSVP